ncbi:hypothetical protein ALP66_100906 [Pseudomonas amygdali pv. photiniae]|uniref:Uncharacterized protein n=3 Tax=Pseudomonas syringae group TaxID=136849 RepID=A0A3M5G0B7_PSESS|nr:Uncharacterized protein ALO79_00279 [Pseudomonas syringae pv. castaneae]KPX59313.1 hypothetical protein ALO53_100844 [Pseudomonas amygdali pv. photiniae]RMO15723.1 hypothetical protein ALQ45_100648 [Pseudomonas amygdali pv. morsprunorum]RMS80189.1 hypothetical protein ALP59_100830 [Pseudomonas savastanoi]RMP00945.1 hypothetical protein ALQ31_00611 [Pseudomonas amygdali pv. morsprunorum]
MPMDATQRCVYDMGAKVTEIAEEALRGDEAANEKARSRLE